MSDLTADLGTAIHYLLKEPSIIPGFRAQFRPQDRSTLAVARSINAAFLIGLTGKRLGHPARGYLTSMTEDPRWGNIAGTYLEGLDRIEEELSGPGLDDAAAAARDLARHLDTSRDLSSAETLERFWKVFFPEGVGLLQHREEAVRELRKRRTVIISELNAEPIINPHEQILFSSNVLLTVPLKDDLPVRDFKPEMMETIKSVMEQRQMYWYDHPIPVGIKTGRNEAVYGLRALDQAVRFEIERGNAPGDTEVPVILSISTTHHGLQDLAHEYLALELEKAGGIDHLIIYAAAEKDTRELLNNVLLPAADHFFPGRDPQPLVEILGVDGEYGRHYSFLKAAAALWQVLVSNGIKATFKIDLDQVFEQETLVSETGRSAFEHLCDPLWGAVGTDSRGRDVELGMLAGALVNESDINKGLFTPDIKWPSDPPSPEEWIFASNLPQALSTEGEMMVRYGEKGLDGQTTCLQRVHVTGGTTGIMVDHLRRHRPFTPGWIGRAEDQAYLLPVLFQEKGPSLRYVHASGLIMRHDKEAFAADVMEVSRIGKLVGDYIRILTYTTCAHALPWETASTKEVLDPFTGCFITRFPVTVAYLRMALKAADMFAFGTDAANEDAVELVQTGSARLCDAVKELCDEAAVRDRLQRERDGWDLYFDVLVELEKGLEEGDGIAETIRDKARELVEKWRIKTG